MLRQRRTHRKIGYGPCQLGGKSHQLLTQLSFTTSKSLLKEKCTSPTTCVQIKTQRTDPVKCASQAVMPKSLQGYGRARPRDSCDDMFLWLKCSFLHSKIGLDRQLLPLVCLHGLVHPSQKLKRRRNRKYTCTCACTRACTSACMQAFRHRCALRAHAVSVPRSCCRPLAVAI